MKISVGMPHKARQCGGIAGGGGTRKDARSRRSSDRTSMEKPSPDSCSADAGAQRLSNNQRKAQERLRRDILRMCEVIKEKTRTPPPEVGKQPNISFEEFKSIFESVEALRQLEFRANERKSPKELKEGSEQLMECSAAVRQQRMDAFLKWCDEMGAEISPAVELHDFGLPYGYGLRAARGIPKGEVLFRIPSAAMMTLETAEDSHLGEVMGKETLFSGMEPVKLALHVLEEKWNSESKWASYLAVLPNHYTTTLDFNLEDYELLRGTSAFYEAMKHFRNIARQYAYFKRYFLVEESSHGLKIAQNFSFDEYRWAVSTVTTRQNRIPAKKSGDNKTVSGSRLVLAMIPFFDFANHHPDGAGGEFAESECLCVAEQDISGGDQVFIRYGRRDNWQTLVHNGYIQGCRVLDEILPFGKFDVRADRFTFDVEFTDSDPVLRKAKVKIMEKLVGAFPPRLPVSPQAPYYEPDFLTYARTAVASEEFLRSLTEPEMWLLSCENAEVQPRWTRLCREAVTWICVRAAKAIKAFPIPTDEMIDMLKAATDATRDEEENYADCERRRYLRRMALSLAITEKKVLERLRPWLVTEIKRLGLELERQLSEILAPGNGDVVTDSTKNVEVLDESAETGLQV